MNYEGQICRPPMERASFMLPVEVGCSYNRCRFCTLFKHLKFRELPMSDVEAELQRVKNLGGHPKRIFLGDGNPFGLSTEHLLDILKLIHSYFPDCREINMDATVTNISEKSDEELRRLHEEGIQELYLGIESGMDELLRYMKKDHTVEEAYEQIARLKQAGLIYNAHLMLGLAGAGRGLENAERTAEFINRTGPKRIINFTIFHHVLEERKLLQLLQVPIESYDGFHDHIEVRTRGRLPEDRSRMLAHLEDAIAREERKAS